MADTSTKGMSQSLKAIPAGKTASENTQTNTPAGDATIPIPTLQTIAESLVALELDLKDATAAGYHWQTLQLTTSDGKSGLAIVVYHPEINIGIENKPSGTVFTVGKEPASVVATRRKGSGNA